MGYQSLGLIMDVVVLLFLGITIYFSLRLSRALEIFRQGRREFGQIMDSLTRNIGEARGAIDAMKSAAHTAGRELQEILDEAVLLADELRLINEAGNNLASRLEGLAEKNRKIVQPDEEDHSAAGPGDAAARIKAYAPRQIRPEESLRENPKGERQAFFIRDPDYETDTRETGETGGFKSKAERELYEALQRNKGGGA